jgi:hypothetical protein
MCYYQQKLWDLPADVQDPIRVSAPRDQVTLNVLCLASHALELLGAAGARIAAPSGRKLDGFVRGNAMTEEREAAFADEDSFRLCAFDGLHAADDPTVILHEMAHVLLSLNLGGDLYPGLFEQFGESGAVAEGLADFVALSLWNRIRREVGAGPNAPPPWNMGASFLSTQRDYSGCWLSPPVLPPPNQRDIHAQGMPLCAALILALARLISEHRVAEKTAEQELWRALFAGLPTVPYQDELPLFCCIARAVQTQVSARFRGTVVKAFKKAFKDLKVKDPCPHRRPR